MIKFHEAKIGLNVFYQQPHMRYPEYGVITAINRYVHVLFIGDTTSKACNERDLHWPPDFCAQDSNPPGQLYSPNGT